jgi:opacity protein-like surface antigen
MEEANMKSWATVLIVTAGSFAMASPGMAQNRSELVPVAGFILFDDLLRGPIGTSLTNSNGTVVGAQIGVPIAGPLSLFAGGGYARSDLTIGLPIIGGVSVGQTDAWMFDGGLQLRARNTGRIAPLVQLGAGGTHYRISNSILETTATNAVVTLGAGVDFELTPNIGLRLMAKDYVGKFDFKEAAFVDIDGRTSHNVGLVAGLRLSM